MSDRRTRPPRRGRRVLAWAAVCFVAVQLTVSTLLDYAWPQVRFPGFFEQAARTQLLPGSVEVVCLGSSRTGFLLDEDVLARELGGTAGRAVNAWAGNGDATTSERMLRELAARGVRPRCVVVEVLPEGVNHRSALMDRHVTRQLTWDEVPAYVGEAALTSNLVRLVGSRLWPCYVYRDPLRRFVAASCRETSPDDPRCVAAGVPAEFAERWHETVARLQGQAPPAPAEFSPEPKEFTRFLRGYRPGGRAGAALERLLAGCRDDGTQVVLLALPQTRVNRACHTPEIEAAFQAYVRRLTETYGCRFADYRDLYPDRLFIDPVHAGAEARAQFSRRLAAEVLEPALGDVARRPPPALPARPVSREGAE